VVKIATAAGKKRGIWERHNVFSKFFLLLKNDAILISLYGD